MVGYRHRPAHRTAAVRLAHSRLGSRTRIFDDDDVIELLRAAIEREGNQGAFARRHEIERSYVNQILNRKKPVSSGILKALGLRRVYAPVEQDPEQDHG
jgi:hypothetical protein